MHDLWPEIVKFGSWLITSGALAGALRSLYTAVKKKRAGVSVRDAKRRLDLAAQVRVLTVSLYAHREVALTHGIPLEVLPALPAFLKEPT